LGNVHRGVSVLVTSIRITVYGSPAPQGSKKFVGTTKAGRGIMVESSKKVRPWRQDVSAAALAARNGADPLDGALRVRMVFTLPKPASSPKRRRSYPSRKPDLSKLARSTEDALVDAGVIADDARIVEYARLAKVFPGEDSEALEASGVLILIEHVDPEAAERDRQHERENDPVPF
jgi:crossover junction endodeoxyribonuclease RusA